MPKKKEDFIENGTKLVGETLLIPGSSLLLDGNVKSGLLHIGAGALAKIALGVPGMFAVAANSYCTSLTGKGIIGNLLEKGNSKDVMLKKKVKAGMKEGLTLEEINARLVEDIEDIYEEAGGVSQIKREE